MTRNLYALACLLCFFTSLAQIKGTVTDSETKVPIPYVNIWIANEGKGTTADENGYFILYETDSSKTVLFSAVGYADTSVRISELKETIMLAPQTIQLNEVIINAHKDIRKRVINPFAEIDNLTYFGKIGELPEMHARLIPYKDEYASTPFINKIRLACSEPFNKSVFNLRLYTVDDNGNPGDFLYNENILVQVKKKQKFVTIDLSEFNIKIPEKGFFVVVEWLIIDKNKHPVYKNIIDETGKAIPKKDLEFLYWHYEPGFGIVLSDIPDECRFFTKGQWQKEFPYFNGKYYTLAAEVTLTD